MKMTSYRKVCNNLELYQRKEIKIPLGLSSYFVGGCQTVPNLKKGKTSNIDDVIFKFLLNFKLVS